MSTSAGHARRGARTSLATAGAAGLAGAAAAGAVAVGAIPFAICAGVAAVAAAGAAVMTRRRDVQPSAAPAEDPIVDLVQLQSVIKGKVPQVIQARVDRVAKTVADTLPRMDRLGPGSAQAHSVVATATSYLPEAVGAYLRLPRDYADRRPVSGGKTSLMVLCDQLDLLANKMDEIFLAVCQADVDALVAHGRFLAEKFGAGSLTINPPRPPSAP